VLLLLYIYVIQTTHVTHLKIPTCFVTPPQTFIEVDDFVTSCARRYNLDVERISLHMKAAFTQYLENHPQIKAVLVGTRRTDPHGEFLTHFDHTDRGWPAFMRVHPVINWHYWEIWDVTSI
jgi:FAD synthetase